MNDLKFILVLITGAIAVVGLCWLGRCTPDPTTTERDFQDDAQRKAFIQRFLPVPMPPGASDIRLEHTRWQDDCLEASFRLDQSALTSFVEVLNLRAAAPTSVHCWSTSASAPAVTSQPDGTYHFVTPAGYDTGTIHIDGATRTVRISCYSF